MGPGKESWLRPAAWSRSVSEAPEGAVCGTLVRGPRRRALLARAEVGEGPALPEPVPAGPGGPGAVVLPRAWAALVARPAARRRRPSCGSVKGSGAGGAGRAQARSPRRGGEGAVAGVPDPRDEGGGCGARAPARASACRSPRQLRLPRSVLRGPCREPCLR